MEKIVDCRGMLCPQPVIATRDALAAMAHGVLTVAVDNEASRSNVERFAVSQGCAVAVAEEAGVFRLTITKPGGAMPAPDAAAAESYTCPIPAAAGVIYVIPSDTMGHGDDDLGRLLLRAFVKTIREMQPRPAAIFFYNTGVRVTAADSDLIPPLKELEAEKVAIFSCGTCLDFFNLKEQLLVGKVTNMYEIMAAMSTAARVVSPY
ncbi:MAG: sulfurtransferase-like selenium metabolism protein YedF [Thermodesulfobacteriota bacterium]